MSGLGDLAVVDLLEGVEALAGGRHGVHKMHGGGSLFEGISGLKVAVYVVWFDRRRSVGRVLRVWLSFPIHMKLERKSRALFGSAKISKICLRLHYLASFTIARRRRQMQWEG